MVFFNWIDKKVANHNGMTTTMVENVSELSNALLRVCDHGMGGGAVVCNNHKCKFRLYTTFWKANHHEMNGHKLSITYI